MDGRVDNIGCGHSAAICIIFKSTYLVIFVDCE